MISNTKFAYRPVQVISGGNKQDIVKGLGWYFGQNFFYYHRFRILKWKVFLLCQYSPRSEPAICFDLVYKRI